jgi:hypothetical protein
MRNFAAAGRVADMNSVLEIKRFHQFRNIGRIGVHFVAGVCLARAPVSTPIRRDGAIAVREEEQHLAVPLVA